MFSVTAFSISSNVYPIAIFAVTAIGYPVALNKAEERLTRGFTSTQYSSCLDSMSVRYIHHEHVL